MFSTSAAVVSITVIPAAVISIWILWNILSWYRKLRTISKAYNAFPTKKLRFYDVFGHIQYLVANSAFGKPFPFQVYVPNIVSSLSFLYGKDGILFVWLGFHPSIIICGAEASEVILKNSTEIRKSHHYDSLAPWLGSDGILLSYGSQWRNRRKLLTSIFHFKILKDYLAIFNKQSRILVQVLQESVHEEFIDVLPFMKRCCFDIICESTLGVEVNCQITADSEYVKNVQALLSTVVHRFYRPWLWPEFLFRMFPEGKRFYRTLKSVNDFLRKIIQERLKERQEVNEIQKDCDETAKEFERKTGKSLLELLLDEHLRNKSISLEEIEHQLNTFMFAGHDTSSISLSWCLYMIGLHPEVQRKLHAEMDNLFVEENRDLTMDDLKKMVYLEMVIKESTRIYSTIPLIFRELQNPVQYKEYTLLKGTTCLLLPYLLHRNPKLFPNPEVFDPDRFLPGKEAERHPFAFIPFSAGPRNCLGQKYAMIEMKCILYGVLRRFEIESLDPRDKVFPVFDIVLTPLTGIRLKLQERKIIQKTL